jgi:hypothetical protein
LSFAAIIVILLHPYTYTYLLSISKFTGYAIDPIQVPNASIGFLSVPLQRIVDFSLAPSQFVGGFERLGFPPAEV